MRKPIPYPKDGEPFHPDTLEYVQRMYDELIGELEDYTWQYMEFEESIKFTKSWLKTIRNLKPGPGLLQTDTAHPSKPKWTFIVDCKDDSRIESLKDEMKKKGFKYVRDHRGSLSGNIRAVMHLDSLTAARKQARLLHKQHIDEIRQISVV